MRLRGAARSYHATHLDGFSEGERQAWRGPRGLPPVPPVLEGDPGRGSRSPNNSPSSHPAPHNFKLISLSTCISAFSPVVLSSGLEPFHQQALTRLCHPPFSKPRHARTRLHAKDNAACISMLSRVEGL